ncbi:MAG TPA: tetratricopeptide repeat protein, partial [Methanomicrobia archaeon]|nr:tetratricopeptide repeat protein [Methanomicrobia archaeon]
GSSINGKIEIKISSDADNVKLRIPIIISGTKGKCACTPFMEGPFYAEITVKNKGIEAFNYAESLHNEGKYEEAMEKYDEAKRYFLNYFDEKNARICLIKAKNCEGHLKLNLGISYFNAGDLDNAKKEFEDAKSIFEDEEMIKICEEWIEKCIPPSTTPPATTPLPTTLAPTTSPPTTPPVTTPLTTSPQGSNSKTIFLILLFVAIASVIIFTIKITKK